MSDITRLVQVIEPEVNALGFDLVRVRLFKGGEIGDEEQTLQIMAERPETGQLVLDDCAALSHRISDKIDELEEAGEILIADAYRLEVSSPGIDRPLTRLKDYTAWVGHEVRINLVNPVEGNRKSLHGDLAGLEGETILLDDRKSGRLSFPFSDVHAAKLVLTDRLIAAAKPIDTAGAELEEIDDEDTADEASVLEQQED